MLKALFVINPSSGRQNFLESIEKIISRLIMEQIVNHIDVVYTKKQNDAREAVIDLHDGDYDFITAIGGDGTINEVISGIADGDSNIPIAIISAGTVNDFANYLNLPTEVEPFINMIKNFRTKKIDVGSINGKIFMNVVAGGIATDVGYNVSKEMKAMFGKAAYYVEGMKEIPKQFFKPFKLKIESEEYNDEAEYLLIMVTNSQSVGGYKQAAPLASVSDGMLDVLLLRKMEVFQVSELLFRFLAGDHINSPAIEYFQTKAIKITSLDDNEMSIDYDGEYYGTLPADIHILEGRINVIIPATENASTASSPFPIVQHILDQTQNQNKD
ncbi:MAG: diacylglycerol kinase family lipid kinase [Lachnospiraceae bacterium]|nr:diacylglycerol kinase family lipid kinase [Lachnospiraceae bacterium]